MPRDYETPDDYADTLAEREANDDWVELQRDADKEEAAIRRWEERREMPYDEDHEGTYVMWLRREEYGDQDPPANEEGNQHDD